MKYIVLVGDGMADYPLKELGGKTPLEAANKPNMNFIAKEGIVGTVKTIPDDLPSGSDVANLNVLGYNPLLYYTGRGPLEAANLGVSLGEDDIAFRCNIITVNEDVLFDYSAGHISDAEAKELIEFINEKLGTEYVQFYAGTSYRHLTVFRASQLDCKFQITDIINLKCTPPHDITGKRINEYLPQGKGREILIELMNKSIPLLEEHHINKVRRINNNNVGNMIWLWGQGKRPSMLSFKEKFGVTGSIISAVNLIKGIGIYAGLKVINVPGATGFFDTNYKGKADAALESLIKDDFVFVHVEAPDEAGHMGKIDEKIRAIEDFDRFVVGTILEGIKKFDKCKILILPDHPTPIPLMTHSREAVPFAIYGSDVKRDDVLAYDEKSAVSGSMHIEEGYKLMEYFIRENREQRTENRK